jgi:hypothetical protein
VGNFCYGICRGRAGTAPFMFHSDTHVPLLGLFIDWTKCFDQDGDLAPKFCCFMLVTEDLQVSGDSFIYPRYKQYYTIPNYWVLCRWTFVPFAGTIKFGPDR